MNKLQKNLYKLLLEIDNICNEYDIDYFLAYGNSLGAIRHNRFLPWDDDIDILITRENWDKLKKVIEIDGDKINVKLDEPILSAVAPSQWFKKAENE